MHSSILKRLQFIAPLTLLLTAGCITVDYVGDSYPPTTKVDTYYAEKDISKPHKVMGSINLDATDFVSTDKIRERMIQEAMARGADGVLFTGFEKIQKYTSTEYQEVRRKTGEKGEVVEGYEKPNYENHTIITGIFLKYAVPVEVKKGVPAE